MGSEKVDYAANSRVSKEEPKPRAEPSKVVTGTVVKQKKSIGSKFRETFLAADAKSVVTYVVHDVMLPALRDMFFDTITKGSGRMMYGERGGRPGSNMGVGPSRINYSTPVNRTFQGVSAVPLGQRMFQTPSPSVGSHENFVLASRDDAEIIIDNLNDYIREYGVVSLYDLKKMLGFSTPAHTDLKVGWESLRGAQMRQVREGWLMELPTPKRLD